MFLTAGGLGGGGLTLAPQAWERWKDWASRLGTTLPTEDLTGLLLEEGMALRPVRWDVGTALFGCHGDKQGMGGGQVQGR